jgi:hypothetical protein
MQLAMVEASSHWLLRLVRLLLPAFLVFFLPFVLLIMVAGVATKVPGVMLVAAMVTDDGTAWMLTSVEATPLRLLLLVCLPGLLFFVRRLLPLLLVDDGTIFAGEPAADLLSNS